MRRHQWIMLMAVVAAQEEEDTGDALTTTAGKWSVMHFLFSLVSAVPFADGSGGLSKAQKATMVGIYSEHVYA